MQLTTLAQNSRLHLALLLTILAGVLFMGASEPLDGSLESYNAGFYQGRFLRAYQRIGFWELGGRTLLGVVPGEGTWLERTYYHHPPFYPWLLYGLVGESREIEHYRYPSIVATLLLGFALWRFARHLFGGRVASVSLLLLVSCPMLLRYGDMVNPEPLTVLPMFLAIASWHRGRRKQAVGWVFLATLMDWQGCFAVPAMAVLTETTGLKNRVRELLVPFAAAVIGVLLTVALFVHWRGGLSALDQLLSLGSQSTTESASLGEWLRNQADYLFLGIGVSVLLSLAVVCLPGRAGARERRMVLGFLTPGILNVLVFREHAFDHSFWWYFSVPGFCLGGGLFLARGAFLPARMAVGTLILVALSQVALVIHDRDRDMPQLIDQRDRINQMVAPNDLLMRGDEFGPEVFYLSCWTWDAAGDPALVRKILTAHQQGQLDVEVIHYVMPDWVDDVCPGLRETLDSFGPSRRFGTLRYYRFQP